MSNVVAGLSERLPGKLIQAAEGLVIALLLLPFAFLLSSLGDRHQFYDALQVLLLAGGAFIAFFSALFHLLIRSEESSAHRFHLLTSALLAVGVLFF
ncbi:MAG: hypothetical protein D3909_16670, partial [Candidatus Electrothrix sp. ATG1]|nr:hypothetical protein [Candidatus Electrothrix sp. ATG1]